MLSAVKTEDGLKDRLLPECLSEIPAIWGKTRRTATREGRREAMRHYGLAVVSVAAAVIMRMVLAPLMGDSSALLLYLFLMAILLSAWCGGFGPGFVATIVSAAAAVAQTGSSLGREEWIPISTFVLQGTAVSWLFDLRLRAERQRLAAFRRERHAVNELEKKARELERSNEDLERFAFAVSHDLQEPLRMVSAYGNLLSRRYKGQLGTEGDEFLGYIEDGTVRMRELIQDLLTYSRVIHAQQEFTDASCEEAFRAAEANCALSIRESRAVIIRSELPVVRGVQSQLVQVFQNLVSNAIKHRREETPRIEVSAVQLRNGDWRFAVKDNGTGIAREHWERIFLPFKRLTRNSPGSGVGLALCKRVIERHGGSIWLESEEGKGSTFYFTLPKAG